MDAERAVGYIGLVSIDVGRGSSVASKKDGISLSSLPGVILLGTVQQNLGG
jgi:hypothetical protein